MGTYQTALDSEPIYWAAPNIRHYGITQLIVTFVIVAVDTSTLAWYEKTYLEADEKSYDQNKKILKMNLICFLISNIIGLSVASWGMYEVYQPAYITLLHDHTYIADIVTPKYVWPTDELSNQKLTVEDKNINDLYTLDLIIKYLILFGWAPAFTFVGCLFLFIIIARCLQTKEKKQLEHQNEIRIHNDLFSMPTNPILN